MDRVSTDSSEPMRRVMEIPGFGPTGASSFVVALSVMVRHSSADGVVSAWLGLTSCQHSSGGKSILLAISKPGNRYLRTMLIHVYRSVLRSAEAKDKTDP